MPRRRSPWEPGQACAAAMRNVAAAARAGGGAGTRVLGEVKASCWEKKLANANLALLLLPRPVTRKKERKRINAEFRAL